MMDRTFRDVRGNTFFVEIEPIDPAGDAARVLYKLASRRGQFFSFEVRFKDHPGEGERPRPLEELIEEAYKRIARLVFERKFEADTIVDYTGNRGVNYFPAPSPLKKHSAAGA